MYVFEPIKRKSSVPVAKDRLKVLLVSDRIHCTPDILEKITSDFYQVVSKYLEITPESFRVQITRSGVAITYDQKTGETS